MMHGRGKSDPAIVARKPANKAGLVTAAAAEPVEPRAGTEGNCGPAKHAPGAGSGISVSQALERIRKVARERRQERFTALFHHLSVALFEEAFFALRKEAAPEWTG